MASQFHNLAVKLTDLLPDGIARFEQRSDRSYQLRTALDQLLGSHGEDIELGCGIRGKAATDSDGRRPPIPIQSGHPIRTKAATLLIG